MSRFLLSVFGEHTPGQQGILVICATSFATSISEQLTLIDVFLVVGDQGLGDSLTDGVDLRSVTTAGDANTDVDLRELVETDDQKGLVNLL